MNTPTNLDDSKRSLEDLFRPRSEEVELKHDAFMLMAAFLSEIEYVQEQDKISRKDLAKNIKISASYLTQVFRNKKPLNFLTLAKIKRALDLRFEIRALRKEAIVVNHEYYPLSLYNFAKDSMSQTSDTIPTQGSKFNIQNSLVNTARDKQVSTVTTTTQRVQKSDLTLS